MSYTYKSIGIVFLLANFFISGVEKSNTYTKKFEEMIRQKSMHEVEIKDLEFVVESPCETLEKRAGFISESIEGVIHLLKHSDKYNKNNNKPPMGMILYGPPGTGKTSIARIIAGESKRKFIAVSSSQFAQKYVGSARIGIVSLFNKARSLNEPVIICIDEIDGSCRDGEMAMQGCYDQMRNALIQELDKKDPNIFIIGTTNYFDKIDKAIINRFQSRSLEIGLPDLVDREDILKYYLQTKNPDINQNFLAFLAQETQGYSGRLLEELVDLADCLAIKKDQDFILQEDFYDALYALNNNVIEDRDLSKNLLYHYTQDFPDNNLDEKDYNEVARHLINITSSQIKNICKRAQLLADQQEKSLEKSHFYLALYLNHTTLKPNFEHRRLLINYYLLRSNYQASDTIVSEVSNIINDFTAAQIMMLVHKATIITKKRFKGTASEISNGRVFDYDIDKSLILSAYMCNKDAPLWSNIYKFYLLDYGLIHKEVSNRGEAFLKIANCIDKYTYSGIENILDEAQRIAENYKRQEIIEDDLLKAVHIVSGKKISDKHSVGLLLNYFSEFNYQGIKVSLSSECINNSIPLFINYNAKDIKKVIDKSVKIAYKMDEPEVLDKHFIIALCKSPYLSQRTYSVGNLGYENYVEHTHSWDHCLRLARNPYLRRENNNTSETDNTQLDFVNVMSTVGVQRCIYCDYRVPTTSANRLLLIKYYIKMLSNSSNKNINSVNFDLFLERYVQAIEKAPKFFTQKNIKQIVANGFNRSFNANRNFVTEEDFSRALYNMHSDCILPAPQTANRNNQNAQGSSGCTIL